MTSEASKRVVVVLPTYNERENIAPLISAIKRSVEDEEWETHILVVDDDSPDGTGGIVRELARSEGNLHLLSRRGRLGLGSAYIDGFRWAQTRLRPDVSVQMDADFQHPPEVLPSLIRTVLEGVNVALASRYVEGGGIEGWGWSRRITSKAANLLTSILVGLKVHDATSGFRALDSAVVQEILSSSFSSRGYPYQVESLFYLSLKKMEIREVPYIFRERTAGSSKLSSLEILRFASTLLRLFLRRIRRLWMRV